MTFIKKNVEDLRANLLQPVLVVMVHFLQLVHLLLQRSNPGRIASAIAHLRCVAVRMQGLTGLEKL